MLKAKRVISIGTSTLRYFQRLRITYDKKYRLTTMVGKNLC